MVVLAPIAQLLAPAFACGLNLYATVAVLGMGSRFGWIPSLPDGLKGLEHEIVIASALLLYLVEFVVDKVPHVDSLWDTVHTFIRPIAAALLALGALSSLPMDLQIKVAGAVLAGMMTLLAHTSKAGLRLVINTTGRRRLNTVASLTEDALAVTITILALRNPGSAAIIAATALLVTTLLGPRVSRAFYLGIRALFARLRGFFGHAAWRERNELPASLRRLTENPGPGQAALKVARAALTGNRTAGSFRNGWLVVSTSHCEFLYRSLLRSHRVSLPALQSSNTYSGPWVDVMEFRTDGERRCCLLLLKDGPSAQRVLSDIGASRRPRMPEPEAPHEV